MQDSSDISVLRVTDIIGWILSLTGGHSWREVKSVQEKISQMYLRCFGLVHWIVEDRRE